MNLESLFFYVFIFFIADENHSHVGAVIGVILALIAVTALVVTAVWFIRTRNLLGRKSSGGVAFENPSYLREVNMDHIQVSSYSFLKYLLNF